MLVVILASSVFSSRLTIQSRPSLSLVIFDSSSVPTVTNDNPWQAL